MPALKFFDGTTWNTVGGPGPIGPAGATGPAGPTGATGAWWTYVGTGTPPAGTFSGEKDGDMAVRSSDSEVFKRVSGAWVDQAYALGYAMQTAARAYRNAALTTGAPTTKIVFDTISHDPGNNISLANGRYVCPTTGYYKVDANIAFTCAPSYTYQTLVFKNGVQAIGGDGVKFRGTTGDGVYLGASDIIQCNAGDYLELYAYSDTASALIAGYSFYQALSVVRVDVGGRPGAGWKQSNVTGVPILTGNTGDFCVRTSDGEVFQRASGMWIDQGWSLQGSQMNALYAARAYRNAAFSVASGWNKVPLDKTSFDAIGGFNLPSSRYVCPVSGLYHVDGNVTANTTAAGLFMVAVYKNGVECSSGVGAPVAPASSTETNVNVSDIVQCNAGDYLELWSYSTAGSVPLYVASSNNFLAVSLVAATAIQQHPLQPASQARAYRNAAYSIPVNSNWQKIPLDTKSYDAGNCFDGTGRYTCSVGGFYQVNADVSAANVVYAGIGKNGSLQSQGPGATSTAVSDIVQCNPGDYLELYVYQNSGSAVALNLGAQYNSLSISLVGTTPTTAPANAARAHRNAALSPAAATWTKIGLDTIDFDPGGNVQTANGRYVCPVTGIYDVEALVTFNVSATGTYTEIVGGIYKNGVMVNETLAWPAVQYYSVVTIADKIQCNAGDYLELYGYISQSGATLNTAAVVTFMAVSLLTGSQIGPMGPQGPAGPPGTPPSIGNTAARAYRAAALAVPSAAWTKVPVDTVASDPGARIDAPNGRYVCPVTGNYHVDVNVALNTSVAGAVGAACYRSGTQMFKTVVGEPGSAAAGINTASTSGVVACQAGDVLELWAFANPAVSTYPDPAMNYLAVSQIDQAGPQGPPGLPGGVGNTGARAYRGAAMALTAGTYTKIPMDNVDRDANGHISNGRYNVTSAGWYQVDGLVLCQYTAGANITFVAYIYQNGISRSVGLQVGQVAANGYVSSSVADLIYCNAGDYIELWAYGSAAFGLVTSLSANYLSVAQVDQSGPAGGAANQVVNPYAIVQGYAADRSFSPGLTSLGEVANVLATLIDDMKNAGLIHP